MLSGKRILAVEDSRTIKLQLRMILEREGVKLSETGSEWGMLSKIEEYGVIVDLIIMDLVLNGENGLELIAKLKTNPKYKDIPIMILTDKVELGTIMKAKQLGIKCYLKKPIRKAALISRLEKLLEAPGTEIALNE
ncbi:MAG: response regulator [Bacillota bacterium]|nr:response regulator [Bacillota bacterium]